MPRASSSAKSSVKADSINRKTIIVAVVAVVILLVLLAVVFISPLVFGRSYFIVYTVRGEIFVGKASWFPRLNLTDVYIVQTSVVTPEGIPGGNLQLVPLKDTPWSPKKVYFERDQIIFYGPVEEGSGVAQALKGR